MTKARCQCDPSCTNDATTNSPFCEKHKDTCPRKAPVSNDTPAFSPTKYNKYQGIQESHNCYAYAMGFRRLPKKCTKESCPVSYPQPGYKTGYPEWSAIKGKRCPDILARVLGDAPGATLSTFEQKCPTGYRKIAIVADPDQDYHLYRQDKDGYWSHKPGATKVTNKDTTGRLIYDPQLAARDNKASELDYNRFCSYVCIPAKKIKLKRGGTRKKQSRRHTRKRTT